MPHHPNILYRIKQAGSIGSALFFSEHPICRIGYYTTEVIAARGL